MPIPLLKCGTLSQRSVLFEQNARKFDRFNNMIFGVQTLHFRHPISVWNNWRTKYSTMWDMSFTKSSTNSCHSCLKRTSSNTQKNKTKEHWKTQLVNQRCFQACHVPTMCQGSDIREVKPGKGRDPWELGELNNYDFSSIELATFIENYEFVMRPLYFKGDTLNCS